MPAGEAQFAHIKLAVCQEKHGENQQRLNHGHGFVGELMSGVQPGYVHIYEISRDSGNDCHYKRPVFQKFD